MRGKFNPDTLSECPYCNKKPETYKDTDGMCHVLCSSLSDGRSEHPELEDTCETMSNYPGDETWTKARENWERLVKEAKARIEK